MSKPKEVCTICYKNKATRIDNLYCEKCLDELITELNQLPRPSKKSNNNSNKNIYTIESEYFVNDKHNKKR
jgi:hypothetical protein